MAKNDKKKVQQSIDTSNQTANTGLTQLKQNTLQPEHATMFNNYQNAVGQNKQDYNNIQGQIQTNNANIKPPSEIKFNPVNAGQVNYSRSPETNTASAGYKNFADTGGYSNQDIQDLRARGISPLRAIYNNATQNLSRNRALAGGYSPNFAAANAKMSRDVGMNIADQTSNVNAGLAQAIRQGKLQGLSGLTGIGEFDTNARMAAATGNANRNLGAGQFNTTGGMQATEANNAAQRAADATRLAGTNAQTSLYGTTPAQSSTFGNQVLDSSGQLIQGQQIGNQQGQANVNAAINAAQIPSNTDIALGRIGGIAKIGAGVINPWLGGSDFLGTAKNPMAEAGME